MSPNINASKVVFQTKINPNHPYWPLELKLAYDELTLKELLELGQIAAFGKNNSLQNYSLERLLTFYQGTFGDIYFPIVKDISSSVSSDEKYFGLERKADYNQKIRKAISPVIVQEIKFSQGFRMKKNLDDSIQAVFYGEEWESSPGKRWCLYAHLPRSCAGDFYLYGQLAMVLKK